MSYFLRQLIRQEITNRFGDIVSNLPNKRLDLLSDKQTKLEDEIAVLRRANYRLEQLKSDIEKSFFPVVLFTGEVTLRDFTFSTDFSWVQRPDDNFIIDFQLNFPLLLKSITILNGFYDGVQCIVAHQLLTPTFDAHIVPGVPLKCAIQLSPADRIYLKLQAR